MCVCFVHAVHDNTVLYIAATRGDCLLMQWNVTTQLLGMVCWSLQILRMMRIVYILFVQLVCLWCDSSSMCWITLYYKGR